MRTALWAAALRLCVVQRTGAEAVLQNGSVGAGAADGDPGAIISVIVLPFPSDSRATNGTVNASSSSSTDAAPGPLGGPLLPIPVDAVFMMFDEPAASSGSSPHIPRSVGPLMEKSVEKTNTLASRSRVSGSW